MKAAGGRHESEGLLHRRVPPRAGAQSDVSDLKPYPSQEVTTRSRNWWAKVVSNHRPPACKAGALPLSYSPLSLLSTTPKCPSAIQLRPQPPHADLTIKTWAKCRTDA